MIGLVLFLLVIGALGGGGWFLYDRSQKTKRKQKNVERGLKMMPLLIHLPPQSDDLEVGSRDIRDVTDENISKAQLIYNIISSTAQKGFAARRLGQRHISFEIVGTKGFVNFYAAVPVPLIEVVKQAVVSAYPSARLEEAPDHNIFNPVGKASGVVGGEFSLKENYAFPIATYQDLKRDAMQATLNALSNLEKEDGVAIQYLIRPADSGWRKKVNDRAKKKKEGKDKNNGPILQIFSWIEQLATALVKPPEQGKDEAKKELSSLDQSIVDAMHDKTRSPGFEVVIRLVVSSNINQRSQGILDNMKASFALFDAPGKNGFRFTAMPNEELIPAYVMRLFPQEKNKTILNAVEMATIFHFPDQRSTPTSQVERQDSKQVDGPRNMPDEGLLLGYNVFRGIKKPIRLGLGDRQRHMYVVGQTGTGKSTFLENLALQDMLSGNGFAFVDPHGDTAEKLLSMVPKERTEDVIYFCPAETDYPMGLNLFEFHNADQKDFIVQEVLNMLYKLYDPQHQGIMGPRYEDMFRNAALAVMADPNGGTFIDIPQLFRNPDFLKKKLLNVKDQTVLDFWQKQFPASQRSNEAGEVTAWFVSKFGAFLSNEMMRNIIGQTKSSFNLRDIMDNKKILIVNLSKGRTGDLNSKLLGMIFVMKFQAAAMSRADTPEDKRVDFALYVDEFQNFSTDSFATIMSEARKYRLNLIVANQFTTQLTEEIRDAVFGNMGTVVAYRIGQNDVDALSRYFQPQFDSDDLLRVPNYNSIVRTLVGGVPTQPFSMAALPPLGTSNPKLADALKQLSSAKFGRPRAKVEEEIFARFKTDPPAGAAFGSRPNFGAPAQAGGMPGQPSQYGGGAQARPPMPPAPKPAGSFLDDWLAKKGGVPGASPQMGPAATPASSPYAQPQFAGSPAPAFGQQPPQFAPTQSPAQAPMGQSSPAPIGTQNISGGQGDMKEVDGVAQQLKAQMSGAQQPSSEGEVNLRAKKEDGAPVAGQGAPAQKPAEPDDAIYIDQDGNLNIKDQIDA